MRGARRGALALLAGAVLLLTACGGEEGEETPGAQGPEPTGRAAERAEVGHAASPQPGSKAAAPGVPTSEHGDNSIQTWGREASSAERVRAATLVQRYLDARAAREHGLACSLLAPRPRSEQRRFAGGAPCPKAMASFTAGIETAELREEARIEVLSLRVGGGYAFLIYRRPDGFFAMPLEPRGDRLRLLLATANPIY